MNDDLQSMLDDFDRTQRDIDQMIAEMTKESDAEFQRMIDAIETEQLELDQKVDEIMSELQSDINEIRNSV